MRWAFAHLKSWLLGFMFWAISMVFPFSDYFKGDNIFSFCCLWEATTVILYHGVESNEGRERTSLFSFAQGLWLGLPHPGVDRGDVERSLVLINGEVCPDCRSWGLSFSFRQGREEVYEPYCELLFLSNFWRAVFIQAQEEGGKYSTAFSSAVSMMSEWWSCRISSGR